MAAQTSLSDAFRGWDSASAGVAINLWLSDIRNIQLMRNAAGQASRVIDSRLALDFQAHDLRVADTKIANRQAAEGIAGPAAPSTIPQPVITARQVYAQPAAAAVPAANNRKAASSNTGPTTATASNQVAGPSGARSHRRVETRVATISTAASPRVIPGTSTHPAAATIDTERSSHTQPLVATIAPSPEKVSTTSDAQGTRCPVDTSEITSETQTPSMIGGTNSRGNEERREQQGGLNLAITIPKLDSQEVAAALDVDASKGQSKSDQSSDANEIKDDREPASLPTKETVENGTMLSITNTTTTPGESETDGGHDNAETDNNNDDDEAECVACGDSKQTSDLVEVECEHSYCFVCIQELIRNACKTELDFPPRCCQVVVNTENIRPHLTEECSNELSEKTVEFNTTDRIYCANPMCSIFLNPAISIFESDHAVCPKCGEKTCKTCKGREHGGDCPDDLRILETLQLARERGWQRCYKCHQVVEITTGCNHMKCRCGAEFCYLCGKKFKTCSCSYADRDHVLPPRDLVPRALIPRDLCTHPNYRETNRGGRCQVCEQGFPLFLCQCHLCDSRLCAGCVRAARIRLGRR